MLLKQIHRRLHCIIQTANLYSFYKFLIGQKPEAAGALHLAVTRIQMQREKRQIIVPCEASVGKPVLAAATEHVV